MSWSLQRRLARSLVAAIVVAGLAATATSYLWALDEAHEIQDQQLDQVATVVRASSAIDFDASSQAHRIDEDARMLIQPLAHSVFPAQLASGFHTLRVHGKSWRVLVTPGPHGAIVVAQRVAWRNESARAAARGTLIPIFALIPLLLLAVALAVRANFQPVATLAATLDARDEFNLAVLPESGLAVEIVPFIASINRLLRRLDLALNQQRRFIADAAHELRTPLAALNLQAQNLRHARTPDEMQQRLLPLLAGLARSEQLLAQLLSLARQQSGDGIDRQRFDPEAAMLRVVGDLFALAEARDIDLGLTASVALDLPGSGEAFYSLLRNAVDNAVRYSPDGARVDVRARIEDGALVVEVEDSGPGIAATERERVFDAFYRMAGTTAEGSGLGLTIAATAAQQLGGAITLHQAASGGVLFRYRQPLT